MAQRGHARVGVYRLPDGSLFLSRRSIFDSSDASTQLWGLRLDDHTELLVNLREVEPFLVPISTMADGTDIHPDAVTFLNDPPLGGLPEADQEALKELVAWHRELHPLALQGREVLGDYEGTATTEDGSWYTVTIRHLRTKQESTFRASWRHRFCLEHFLGLAYRRLQSEDAYKELVDADVRGLRSRHNELVREVKAVFKDWMPSEEDREHYHHGPNPDFLDFHDYDRPLGYLDHGKASLLSSVAFHVGHAPATHAQTQEWGERLYALQLERALRAIHAYLERAREVLDWATDPDSSRYHSHITITLYQEGLLYIAQWLHTALCAQASNERVAGLLEDVEDLLVRQVAPPLRVEAAALERLLCILHAKHLTAGDAEYQAHCPIDWSQRGLQLWMEDRLSRHGLYKRVP